MMMLDAAAVNCHFFRLQLSSCSRQKLVREFRGFLREIGIVSSHRKEKFSIFPRQQT